MSETRSRALLDPQGCLTSEAFRLLESATPGQAPAEVAAHLAACARCQQRALAPLRQPARPAPNVWRNLGFALLGGAVLLIAVLLLGRLTG